jgi:glutathione S-transferase
MIICCYVAILLLISLEFMSSFVVKSIERLTSARSSGGSLALNAVTLFGSQQTRSPLVNWYLLEKDIPFVLKPPRPSPNPFGQVPYLQDGEVEVFESGAVLLYLADAYGGYANANERAKYTKWVVWANSELDKLCFGTGMRGTMLDKPNVRALDVLNQILEKSEWLVDNKFSVADVAVGSYLNYVPVFFQDVNPANRQAMVRYMERCANRPKFAEAFGEEHASLVKKKAKQWQNKGVGGFFGL